MKHHIRCSGIRISRHNHFISFCYTVPSQDDLQSGSGGVQAQGGLASAIFCNAFFKFFCLGPGSDPAGAKNLGNCIHEFIGDLGWGKWNHAFSWSENKSKELKKA